MNKDWNTFYHSWDFSDAKYDMKPAFKAITKIVKFTDETEPLYPKLKEGEERIEDCINEIEKNLKNPPATDDIFWWIQDEVWRLHNLFRIIKEKAKEGTSLYEDLNYISECMDKANKDLEHAFSC